MFSSLNIPPSHPLAVPFGNRLTRFLGKLYLKMGGWRIEGTFGDERHLILAVAPHTSNWDFPLGLAVTWAVGSRFSWLGKHTLFKKPFGRLMRSWGGIPVNRSAPGNVIDHVASFMLSQPWCYLAISPEGTRKRVEHWKTGFLRIARKARVSVQLVYFDYGKRVIGLGRQFLPGDDMEADLAMVREQFAHVTPRCPERF